MNKWDKKAKNYNRYNEKENSFEQRVFKSLKDLHVEFEGKTLVDIGAGTGVYTLHLAQKCLHVDAIDSSKEMLQILKQDAQTLHINNITTYTSSWQDFDVQNKYDIALCTMSPAIRTDSDLDKMQNCAKIKIYLGWAGKRDTEIIDKLFLAHNKKYIAPNGALSVKNWLNKNKKFFQVIPFEEEKIRIRSYDEAIENFTWHLDVRGVNPKIDKIKEVLKDFVDKDGMVTEKTINHMNLIVWG